MQAPPAPWIRRSRLLTQALLISGSLNIALLAGFVYFVLKERQEIFSTNAPNLPSKKAPIPLTNSEVFDEYCRLSQKELLHHLENKTPLEEGLMHRDLAIACLVAFHHFHIEKALHWAPLQRRVLRFTHPQELQTIDIPFFLALSDEQFEAIVNFARTEKWPLTAQGLFFEIKRSWPCQDPTLLSAFVLTSEYQAVDTLFAKTGLILTPQETIALIAEGQWHFLSAIKSEFTPERRREFLIQYVAAHSKSAVKWLLESDIDFVAKRFNDAQVLYLLDLYPENDDLLKAFAKRLINSPRTDAVWRKAATLLPEEELASPPPPPQLTHTVEPGENLWKIARKYKVSTKELMQLNHLETEKIRPGKKLMIPQNKPE